MSPKSGIYTGEVLHARYAPIAHDFRYRLYMLYLDLGELDELFAGRLLWSLERRNLYSFRRADYLGDPEVPDRKSVV